MDEISPKKTWLIKELHLYRKGKKLNYTFGDLITPSKCGMNGVLLNLWLYQFITLVEGLIPLDYEKTFFYKQAADSTAITTAGFVLMNKNDFDYEVIFSEIKMYPI